MRSVAEQASLSGTGWNADTIKLLAQRTSLGQRPNPNSWRYIDVTSGIN